MSLEAEDGSTPSPPRTATEVTVSEHAATTIRPYRGRARWRDIGQFRLRFEDAPPRAISAVATSR